MENIITSLLQEEVDEIETYFERMNSLKELTLVFESDKVFLEKSSIMYEKLIKDMSDTRMNFQLWWTRMIDKYKLNDYDQNKLFVDFIEKGIRLQS